MASFNPIKFSEYLENTANLLFIASLDNDEYLALLEYCDSIGITYQNLCASFGINDFYALDVYLNIGIIPYIWQNDVYYLDINTPDDKHFSQCFYKDLILHVRDNCNCEVER
jgi:hypothetical protein